MTDRIGPPAWVVKPDPSDLPRILRELKKAAEQQSELALTPLAVQVLWHHIQEVTDSRDGMTPWQVVANSLPAPTDEEIAQWADGIVHHRAADGTLLVFDRVQMRWFRKEEPR